MKLYKSNPVLKERIWGGQKLKQYNKCFECTNIGESWETEMDSMPVLIKLIDANDKLSVQVHPSDDLAWKLEGQKKGKTEAWIILDCDEGAEIVAGIKRGTTRSQLELALEKGSIQELLNIRKVKKGDCIYIPAGTVHSFGKGLVVYEVQQPSDLTYRLYDWNRTDEEGRPRELHIRKALNCIDYDIVEVRISNLYDFELQPRQAYIAFQNEYFTTSYLSLEEKQQYSCQINNFAALTIISGSVLVSSQEEIKLALKGDTVVSETCRISLQALENTELIITEYP